MGRDIELQNTHIVLFKSTRDVLQINTLSQQLGLGSQVKGWYTKATSVPYGNLLIDVTPKTVDSHNIDEQTTSLYTDDVKKYSQNFKKKFLRNCPKHFIQFLNDCIVNLLWQQLQEIQNVIKYRDEIYELVLKRTGIKKEEQFQVHEKEKSSCQFWHHL